MKPFSEGHAKKYLCFFAFADGVRLSGQIKLTAVDFFDLSYLQSGNAKQKSAYETIKQHSVFEKLGAFTPFLAGTIPLQIDIEDSDLDILCCFADAVSFEGEIVRHFGTCEKFHISHSEIQHYTTVVVNFRLENFAIEIFGQPRAITEQEGYRHMITEYALLQQYGDPFRKKIISLKMQGLKTEPAFAKALDLKGDPYEALLTLHPRSK